MQEHAATGAAVERPGAFDLLLGAGQIDLGGIRDDQDDRLGGDPGAGGGDVGVEDGVEVGLVVVEEAIGGGRLGVAVAGGGDADGGVPGQVGEDDVQSPVEPLVLEVGIRHLFGDPIGDALGGLGFLDDVGWDHDVTPLVRDLRPGARAPGVHSLAQPPLSCQNSRRVV